VSGAINSSDSYVPIIFYVYLHIFVFIYVETHLIRDFN